MTIENHMGNFLSAMAKEGYPEKSIQMYKRPILCLIRFCKDNDRQEVDAVIVEQFIDYHAMRRNTGKISSGTLDYYRRPARNFLNYIVTGMIHPVRRRTPAHSPLFESIIDDIRTDDIFNTPDRAHMVSAANIFFSWLEENDCSSPSDITLEHIRGFMLNRASSVTGQTLSSNQRRLKLLNSHMVARGLMNTDFSDYLSLPVAIEKKILPAMPLDDIYQLLLSIDRSTAEGKKDYAIVLLAAVTGLRAIDIVKLERSDIDWKMGEIRINQSKTDEPLALPLTKDVGEAVKTYVLDARPQSCAPNIFVHHRAPYAAYANGSIISGRFQRLCEKAGIECRGFHSLRRSVGQRMTIAEIPLMTTSQILGHSGIDVTKQYISLDSRHLSICALSFDGIRPGGGIYA